MLGGLQAGEVKLVDVKSLILDMGLWPLQPSGPAPPSCRLSPVVTDVVDVGFLSVPLGLVLELSWRLLEDWAEYLHPPGGVIGGDLEGSLLLAALIGLGLDLLGPDPSDKSLLGSDRSCLLILLERHLAVSCCSD